jgi:DNA-directed RNA polymerase subunit RPC12/RpoP
MAYKLFTCNACGKIFRVNVAAQGEENLTCPKCGSDHVYSTYEYHRGGA